MLRKAVRQVSGKVTRTKNGKDRPVKTLSSEQIRGLIEARAYEIYLSRNATDGDRVSDWIAAENQIKKELRLNC